MECEQEPLKVLALLSAPQCGSAWTLCQPRNGEKSTAVGRSHRQQLSGKNWSWLEQLQWNLGWWCLGFTGKIPVELGVVMFGFYRENTSGTWGNSCWVLQENHQQNLEWWWLDFTVTGTSFPVSVSCSECWMLHP